MAIHGIKDCMQASSANAVCRKLSGFGSDRTPKVCKCRSIGYTLLSAGLAVFSATAVAQSYPSSPITVVVPFAAGGPTDTLARHVTQGLSKTLGQPVNVENIVGASDTNAMANVAKAPADGYRLLFNHVGQARTAT